MSILFSKESNLFKFLKEIYNSENQSAKIGKPYSFISAVRFSAYKNNYFKLVSYGLLSCEHDEKCYSFFITEEGKRVAETEDDNLWDFYTRGFSEFKSVCFDGLSLFESEILKILLDNNQMYLDKISDLYKQIVKNENNTCLETNKCSELVAQAVKVLAHKEFISVIKSNEYRIAHNLIVHDDEMKKLCEVKKKKFLLTKKEQNLIKREKRIIQLWENLDYLRVFEDKNRGNGILVIENEDYANQLIKERKIERIHSDLIIIKKDSIPKEFYNQAAACGDGSLLSHGISEFMVQNPEAKKINVEAAILKSGMDISAFI